MKIPLKSFSIKMKYQHIMAAIAVIIIACLISWQRLTPVTVESSTILNEVIHPGDKLKVERSIKWHRASCTDVAVDASLIDSLGVLHRVVISSLKPPPGSPDVYREWPIPFDMPLGTATYKTTITFWCPPLYSYWPITVDFPDLKFMISPKKFL